MWLTLFMALKLFFTINKTVSCIYILIKYLDEFPSLWIIPMTGFQCYMLTKALLVSTQNWLVSTQVVNLANMRFLYIHHEFIFTHPIWIDVFFSVSILSWQKKYVINIKCKTYFAKEAPQGQCLLLTYNMVTICVSTSFVSDKNINFTCSNFQQTFKAFLPF